MQEIPLSFQLEVMNINLMLDIIKRDLSKEIVLERQNELLEQYDYLDRRYKNYEDILRRWNSEKDNFDNDFNSYSISYLRNH